MSHIPHEEDLGSHWNPIVKHGAELSTFKGSSQEVRQRLASATEPVLSPILILDTTELELNTVLTGKSS